METKQATRPPHPGTSGVWWNQKNPGPIQDLPFINQFGHMKFTRINLDETMKPHLNDGIEIHYVESGKYDWVIENRTVELLPDDLSITAPWQLNGSPSGKMDLGEIFWIVIKPKEFSMDSPLKLGKWTRLPSSFQKEIGEAIARENGIVIRNARKLKHHFIDLSKELRNQEIGFELTVKNIIENIFIELNRLFESRKQQIQEENTFISSLRETILGELSQKWNVEELASRFGMGKTKFTEEVRRLTGYPPNSYIINLKLEEAKNLLLSSEQKLSQIAYACGFSSLQHFTSTFSQRTGTTPASFRRQR